MSHNVKHILTKSACVAAGAAIICSLILGVLALSGAHLGGVEWEYYGGGTEPTKVVYCHPGVAVNIDLTGMWSKSDAYSAFSSPDWIVVIAQPIRPTSRGPWLFMPGYAQTVYIWVKNSVPLGRVGAITFYQGTKEKSIKVVAMPRPQAKGPVIQSSAVLFVAVIFAAVFGLCSIFLTAVARREK